MKKQIPILTFVLLVICLIALTAPAVWGGTENAKQSTGKENFEAKSQWKALFNGKNLDGWTPKFKGYPLGENLNNIFRIENGVLKVSYDETPEFKGEFGHLFYKIPFSHYILRAEFRFVGRQVKGGPDWALRNNGLMIHCQSPESMRLNQSFPTSIEVQLWGSEGDIKRTMGNACTPGTHVIKDGKLVENHVIPSNSGNFFGDQWITVEAEVHGSGRIIHRVNGKEVLRYEKPQLHDGTEIEGGYIAIQAETHPIEFRKIEILPLEGNRAVSHDGRSLSSKMNKAPAGYRSLFDGQSLKDWKLHPKSRRHWKVTNGVIDYDALSKAPENEKHLWTKESFGDFELRIDWRIKRTGDLFKMPTILPDGTKKKDENGKVIRELGPNADSGILLRGRVKSQVNIWCWPVGSGEVWGYRTDPRMPPEVRAAATPKVRADRAVGEWNNYIITMKGDRLTVVLNGQTVIENAQLPGVPEKGPIGLQHHGGKGKNGKMKPASSLVQFRNIFIKEL